MSNVDTREEQKNRIVEKLIKLADKIISYQNQEKQQEKRQASSQSCHTD